MILYFNKQKLYYNIAFISIGYIIFILYMFFIETYGTKEGIPFRYIPMSIVSPITNSTSEVIEENKEYFSYGGIDFEITNNNLLIHPNGTVWKRMFVTTTAYTWLDDGFDHLIGAGDGRTSIGKDARSTYGIAADPRAIPYGSTIFVEGYGTYRVDDTGGALRRSYRNNGEIVLDLRIPNRRYDGVWRSNTQIRSIARNHGRNRNRVVLIQIN